MKIDRIPPDTTLFDNGSSLTYEGGTTAVLLLHGWTGWTGRLAYLGGRLAAAGFTVRLPRLPGHGTNVQDFVASTWKDWLRRAVDEFVELRARSDTVYVAGASMGAILTIMLAAQFQVPRIALLAPAVFTRSRLLFLAPVLQHVIPRLAGDWEAEQDPDPNAEAIGREYKTHNYTKAIAQLYHLQRLGRRILPRLTSDTLVVVSKRDETVPPEVARYITDRSASDRVETLLLEESGHQVAQGVERETVCKAVVDWFTERR
ncbi:MAG: alpha/beta fold hydrolase [Spirochaetia bacterium]